MFFNNIAENIWRFIHFFLISLYKKAVQQEWQPKTIFWEKTNSSK